MKSLTLRVAIALAFLLSTFATIPAFANHDDDNGDTTHDFAHAGFEATWAYTDFPVANEDVDRTWMWGPGPYTGGMMESYAQSPDGERLVQYFDKARMEINQPEGDANDLWYVTNGLLVTDMVEGRYQVGDDQFDFSPEPALNQIAGDRVAGTPGYADINEWNLRGADGLAEGSAANRTIVDGEIVASDYYDQYGVTNMHYVDVEHIDKTVASVFWGFMNEQGTVYADGQLQQGSLFQNPFYATGYPITNPYWATVPVEGVDTDVLWQCFERRCLTYTPANDEGWEVEAGNVGMHYYDWRYGDEAPVETETVNLSMIVVSDEDDGNIGCDDSIANVEVQVEKYDDIENRLMTTMWALLNTDSDIYYNVFTSGQTDLEVADVTLIDGVAYVDLTGNPAPGGVCDDPRYGAQAFHTLAQFDEVDDVVLTLDGGPIIENPAS